MEKIKHPNKTELLNWISDDTWQSLSLKEKDYLIFLHVEKLNKEEIMRRLYLTCSKSLRNFRYKIGKKTNNDLKKVKKFL